MAGQAYVTNFLEGVGIAADMEEDVVLFEGSGTAMPPVAARTTVLVASAAQPFEVLGGFFGTYRLLLSDFVVITMAENPFADLQHIQRLEAEVRRVREDARILRTVLRPLPLKPIQGKSVFCTTTAPAEIGQVLTEYLEEQFACEVVGMSHSLAQRERLREELAMAPPFETLLTELKAAAVDVAIRFALATGREVVFTDNRPLAVGETAELEFLEGIVEKMHG
jgi:cyclic 2,3-diphosphoglycerate synthetase